SGQRFRHAAAHDQQVLEDRSGRARADAQLLRRLIETFTQVDPAVGAEGLDRLAGLLVQRPEETAVADEDAILVHRDAAVPEARRAGRAVARIEFPDLGAGGPGG